MDVYKLSIKRSAEKEMDRLPQGDLVRVIRRIESLCENPRPFGYQKLKGERSLRIRQGDYRIIYEVDDETRTVEVTKVGHRREIYR